MRCHLCMQRLPTVSIMRLNISVLRSNLINRRRATSVSSLLSPLSSSSSHLIPSSSSHPVSFHHLCHCPPSPPLSLPQLFRSSLSCLQYLTSTNHRSLLWQPNCIAQMYSFIQLMNSHVYPHIAMGTALHCYRSRNTTLHERVGR